MKPKFLGLSANAWKMMVGSWWEKLLIVFLLASVALGSLYAFYRISCRLVQHWRGRQNQQQNKGPPGPVIRYLDRLRDEARQLPLFNSGIQEIKTFGVFLGGFDRPPTLAQARLLSQWDAVILDPLQDSVLDALPARQHSRKYTIGRLSMRSLLKSDFRSDSNEVVRSIGVLAQILHTRFGTQRNGMAPFNAVLLADYLAYFQPVVVNEVAKYIKRLGLDFWLEMSPPTYLTESQVGLMQMEHISGIVCVNGTIRNDGDRQNYFQMENLRKAMRAIAAQRARHGPPIMMWETVDDGVELNYAVVRRSYNWCSYISAPCWIGSAAALTDADAAAAHTIADKPLGALMWLQSEDTMMAQDQWRSNDQISKTTCGHDKLYHSLQAFVPDLAARLQLSAPQYSQEDDRTAEIAPGHVNHSATDPFSLMDPLSVSACGDDFSGLGCFHLGLEVKREDFADCLHTQRNLRELNLLQRVPEKELDLVRNQIQTLHDSKSSLAFSSKVSMAIKELLDLLTCNDTDDGESRLQVYVGLHSGFQTGKETQFYGLYDVDMDVLNIYLSGRTQDRAGTILHTFLSHQGITRTECFLAELAMSKLNGYLSERWELSPRMVQDVERLSPSEAILFLRRLTLLSPPADCSLFASLRACCEYQLIDVPTLTQLRGSSSTGYLSGEVSAETIVKSRIAWLREQGCWHPDPAAAISVFEEVSARVHDVLMTGQSELLAQLGVVIQTMLQKGRIDAGADIFALSVFCAFRKLALDEVYLVVLDRNPFPNHSTDQAACFAENFAIGARCASYFDMTPRAVGKLISARYRDYYMKCQPPLREDGFTELPGTYAAMHVDMDPNQGDEELPIYYRVGFLGIFAVPALIDIMLLTTIGRGLYLTTFMTDTEITMATTALMLALLICGAVGSWITSGGSYYLYASAFPAMNMFVLTRFTAGITVILIGGLGGLACLAVDRGIAAGLIFFAYLFLLATYLLTLSAASIYQFQGSRFQSGRTVVMTNIPILFISPLLTLWIGHDLTVYLCVLTFFLTTLLWRVRRRMSQWSTWYLNIPIVTDAEVVDWFVKTREAAEPRKEMEDVAGDGQPRKAIHMAVLKECNRRFWKKRTADALVAKLADGYSSTVFLMSWYSKYKRSGMPLPYSATWNLTLKAGLESMMNMQKGLKLHSAFLHWRHTGLDIWSGLLYFVVALLDKWSSLMTGGHLVGLSAAGTAEYRLPVGFGLCYYLMGAVFLDAISQPLWTRANQSTCQPINSLILLRQATIRDAQARRTLYWRSLVKFFFLHVWGIAITSTLIWVFESARSAEGMYLAYVGAYTGLLWYQYNKIYCGNDGAKSLALAVIVGLPIGIALHLCLPTFAFSGIVSLASGTWLAALHSFWLANVCWPSISSSKSTDALYSKSKIDVEEAPVSYAISTLEPFPELSQATLSQMFESIDALPAELRYPVDPVQYPGARVIELLRFYSKQKKSDILRGAFVSADQILQRTAELWQSGQTVVELVSARHLPGREHIFRTISQKRGDILHIVVVIELDGPGDGRKIEVHRNQRIIAEAIIQATCEFHLGLSHDHAILAELLVAEDPDVRDLSMPEGIRRQLKTHPTERARIIDGRNKTLLRHLLLGIDCEREWDDLPKPMRHFLLDRCRGQFGPLSAEQQNWISSTRCGNDSIEPQEYISRSNLGVIYTTSLYNLAKALEATGAYNGRDLEPTNRCFETLFPFSGVKEACSMLQSNKLCISRYRRTLQTCIKFLVLSLTADPEYQRELDYMTHGLPSLLRMPLTLFLNGIWSFCRAMQRVIIPLVAFHRHESVSRILRNISGTKTTIEKHRIVIQTFGSFSTCFWTTQPDGTHRLSQYAGSHAREPSKSEGVMAVNTYSDKLVLLRREEYQAKTIVNVFTYDYPQDEHVPDAKVPIQRQCIQGKLNGQIVQYDHRGWITTGSSFEGGNPVHFTYWYRKRAQYEDELLRGEYVFPHITIRIFWSMPCRNHPDRLDEWIPFTKVTEAIFIQGSHQYHASWDYEHKFHPEISTTLNGKPISTPPMIREDWFHVLQKPEKCHFRMDNPLFSFSSAKWSLLSRFFGRNIRHYPIPTSHARTHLWKVWKAEKSLDAISARWLDERLLRSDKILATYWRNRDLGLLDKAKDYLDIQCDTVMARVDVDPEISSWVPIAFKMSDFYSFGLGGDSRINTRTLSTQLKDSDDDLHVLAMDNSTWPNEPGGVSNCRNDMVNDLKTIKWHMLAEAGNDYGVPKFQIEKNVQSLTVLPLWGLDFLNPAHGILQNSLDSAIVQRSHDTSVADIAKHFIPILTSLVRCSRTIHHTPQHFEEATKALVDLNTYFESSRNWNDVWNSDIVKRSWRELWLTEDMEDTLSISQWWDFEKPTMRQLDTALDMWHRYLFIFSIPVPQRIPSIFQASHHFTGATYGILCKIKRKCTLQIWDHCISYREFTTFMSSAVSFDNSFVNSTLISLTRLSCVLLLHHADVVLPCAAYFNPGWEIELGTVEGAVEHRRTFARKIDPVVNGICNMEKYEPIKTIRTDKPTVVMLGHIQYVKDVKSAILAADLIVNKWGFTDYNLHIYGDQGRAPFCTTECQELIASKRLGRHCILKGLGNPSVVLQDAWLFLNSSITEGLPLAMGEAALTGVPVVCTDVGASFCVVTDGKTGDRFSEVVPPNEAESLARAQINVLALLGKWSAYAEDAAGTSPPVLGYPNPTPEQVQAITKRMLEKTEQRRRLGMLGRNNVLGNFSSERYLREHEQMLWIGKYRSGHYRTRNSTLSSSMDSSETTSIEKAAVQQTILSLKTPRLAPESWIPLLEKKRGIRIYTREVHATVENSTNGSGADE